MSTAALARFGRFVAASEMREEAKRAYREWSKAAQKAMLRRNQFVHSAWLVPGRNAVVLAPNCAPRGLAQHQSSGQHSCKPNHFAPVVFRRDMVAYERKLLEDTE